MKTRTITLKNCRVEEKEDCFIISIPDHRPLQKVGKEEVFNLKLVKDIEEEGGKK